MVGKKGADLMQPQMLLVFDLDPISGAGEALHSILVSSLDSTAEIKYHPCAASEAGIVIQCVDKALSQHRPSLCFLILSPSLLNEHELLAELLGKTQAPLVAVTKEGEPDEIHALLKFGVAEFLTLPLDARNILPRVRRLLWKATKRQRSLKPEGEHYLGSLVGESRAFIAEVSKIPRIAESEGYVLITGETGTGKELFARAIHDLSPRARNPYIPINCGAIPIELVENELFGHERGAFTGAGSSLAGVVGAADGGTLFLDEVNSLPLPAQAKLLRFLQEKEYRPLGSSRTIKADVRVISAANVDVEEAVSEGKMRLDLYHRLNVMTIKIPPLRDRREDIPLLTNHFLRKCKAGSDGIGGIAEEFTSDAMRILMLYEWPGNVRELEHVIERAVVMCTQQCISGIEVSHAIGNLNLLTRSFRDAMSDYEQEYIRGLLRFCGGNLSQAARVAEMHRPNLRRLIKKYQIDPNSFRRRSGKNDRSGG
jgi:two-component system, NtrC family, response regulator GlrR